MDAKALPPPPGVEFIALVALTTSLVAMAIDTMLPAVRWSRWGTSPASQRP